jgi:hypothetical protein
MFSKKGVRKGGRGDMRIRNGWKNGWTFAGSTLIGHFRDWLILGGLRRLIADCIGLSKIRGRRTSTELKLIEVINKSEENSTWFKYTTCVIQLNGLGLSDDY